VRALQHVGFRSPLAEPGVHLSLCTGLSRSSCEVRLLHPFAAVAHDLEAAHQILLDRSSPPNTTSAAYGSVTHRRVTSLTVPRRHAHLCAGTHPPPPSWPGLFAQGRISRSSMVRSWQGPGFRLLRRFAHVVVDRFADNALVELVEMGTQLFAEGLKLWPEGPLLERFGSV
jgi:hypothetical protein